MKLTESGKGSWALQVPIPTEVIADGAQTILIRDKDSGETLEAMSDPASPIRTVVDPRGLES